MTTVEVAVAAAAEEADLGAADRAAEAGAGSEF